MELCSDLLTLDVAQSKLIRKLGKKEASKYILRRIVIQSHTRFTFRPFMLEIWGVYTRAGNVFSGIVETHGNRGTKVYLDDRYVVLQITSKTR